MQQHDNQTAIRVQDITKIYRLYNRQRDRLWESLGLDFKKNYKEKHALNHVDFEVKKGETVGIIGTNGSGKSTMLKLITGVLTPTSGSISVDGRISALLELGAGFNMEYTGIENVYLNGTMIGFTREEIDQRLQAIIDFLKENNIRRSVRPVSERLVNFHDYDMFEYAMENDKKWHDIAIEGLGWLSFIALGQIIRVRLPKDVALKESLAKIR